MRLTTFLVPVVLSLHENKTFTPELLQGYWNQLATNDPTIPSFCTCNKLLWELSANKKEYTIQFKAKCYDNLNVKVPLHGYIKNGSLYENFKFLPRIHKIDIDNVVLNNETYEVVELLADYNVIGLYKKTIYQLWSRKPMEWDSLKKYIKEARLKHKLDDIRITKCMIE